MKVMIRKASGHNLMSKDEFMHIRLPERISLLMQGNVQFVDADGHPLSARAALEYLASEAAHGTTRPEDKILLVVDDSEIMREGLSEMFADTTCAVYTAGNPTEAMRQINAKQPNVTLIDLKLGSKQSGFDLCRRIRAKYDSKQVRIILMSADVTDQDRAWGLKSGADLVLEKTTFDEDTDPDQRSYPPKPVAPPSD